MTKDVIEYIVLATTLPFCVVIGTGFAIFTLLGSVTFGKQWLIWASEKIKIGFEFAHYLRTRKPHVYIKQPYGVSPIKNERVAKAEPASDE